VVIVFNEVMELRNERGIPCRARLSVVNDMEDNYEILSSFSRASS